jgi:4-alpha-glucanotransferase
MGAEARQFIDLLAEAGQKVWQILPLGPTGYGNSPYQCYSAFAGNPLLIDLALLADDGLLTAGEIENKTGSSLRQVDFDRVEPWKMALLRRAYATFCRKHDAGLEHEYHHFLKEHGWWLKDYALFMALKGHWNPSLWHEWPEDLKFRQRGALKIYASMLVEEIAFHEFIQFLFFRQWFRLREYAGAKGIEFVGDMPLYVSGDSVDVWSNTDLFMLDEALMPTHVGGVPPDYFSETGQLWGNPIYRWDRLEARGYDWWLARLHFNIHLYDRVRIDHFRGLESYWAVPAGEPTAISGQWLPAHGSQLLHRFWEQIGHLPLIAEDLGVITPEVERLRDEFKLPGMKVLQFAFSTDASNEHLPHNYQPQDIAFTGTHDNNTTLGWLRSVKGTERRGVHRYLGGYGERALMRGVEQVWASAAQMAILPMQDLLMLGEEARFNRPGVANGNWEWRFEKERLHPDCFLFLQNLTEKYNR